MSSKRIRVNVQLSAETHRLLRMWCAEQVLTLKDGVEALLKASLVQVGQRVATPPWAREPIAAIPETKAPVVETPAVRPKLPCSCLSPTQIDALCDVHGHLAWKNEPAPPQHEAQGVGVGSNAPSAEPAHVAEALKYTMTGHEVVDENQIEQEAPAFDPQAHYDEVVKKLSPRSALADTLNAIEYFGLEDRYPHWAPGTPAVQNGAASPAAGPITAAEYDVPGTWVDSGGHTRAQNVSRFGEDESVKYWPPGH